ncbi:MAG: hypothetical protein CMH64_03620 [Nanoarchaeota archaeon]|nr:hypothetical protein [Nanoarchaeota archaeon]|tara:strand:+ start:2270 stop:2788 length:519 start_codon:yes stop_codon:yes gene_type:complete
MNYYRNLIFRILIPFIISYEIIQEIALYLTINATHLTLKFFNPNTFLIGDFLSFNETYIKLIPACAAASAYFLLLFLTVFTKDIKLKTGLKIFFLGSLIIFITNLLRIILLVIVLDKFSYNLFNTLHLFFWSIIASALVAIIWIFLTKLYRIRSIPVYSDLKYLIKKTNLYK